MEVEKKEVEAMAMEAELRLGSQSVWCWLASIIKDNGTNRSISSRALVFQFVGKEELAALWDRLFCECRLKGVYDRKIVWRARLKVPEQCFKLYRPIWTISAAQLFFSMCQHGMTDQAPSQAGNQGVVSAGKLQQTFRFTGDRSRNFATIPS